MTSRHARALRARPTEAERRLWSILRYRQMDGHRFRRQAPIGRYVADFVCFERKLVIEVDGGQHAIQTNRDDDRTSWLQSQGFRVLRFWNNDVIENLDGVGVTIRRALKSSPLVGEDLGGGSAPHV